MGLRESGKGFVYPQPVRERLPRYSTIAREREFCYQKKKKGLKKRMKPYRIIIRDDIGRRRVIVAVSSTPQDDLTDEWTYVLGELSRSIPSELTPAARFDWLTAHFNLMFVNNSSGGNTRETMRTTGSVSGARRNSLDYDYDYEEKSVRGRNPFAGSNAAWSPVPGASREPSKDYDSKPKRKRTKLKSIVRKTIAGPLIFLPLLLLNAVFLVVHSQEPLFAYAVAMVMLNTILIQYITMHRYTEDLRRENKDLMNVAALRSENGQLGTHPGFAGDFDNIEESAYDVEPKMTEADWDLDLEDTQLVLPGQTLLHLEEGDSGVAMYGEWRHSLGPTYMVRKGPDYSSTRMKAPSAESIYTPVHMDIYSSPFKVTNVARFFDLMEIDRRQEHTADPCGLPPYLVINVMCPLYAPGVVYSDTDGEQFSVVFFCKLEAQEPTPGRRLLKEFIDKRNDPGMRSRLKAIGRLANPEEVDFGRVLSGLVSRFNATPFIIYDYESEVHVGDNYVELDIDVHSFGRVARSGLYRLVHMLEEVRVDFGLVIEGRTNEQLPEQIVTAGQVYGMTVHDAKPFPFLPSDFDASARSVSVQEPSVATSISNFKE